MKEFCDFSSSNRLICCRKYITLRMKEIEMDIGISIDEID